MAFDQRDGVPAKIAPLEVNAFATGAPSIPPGVPSAWTEQDVHRYLSAVGFAELAPLFLEHEVTGNVLLSLTEDDLERQLGVVKFGPRRRIALAIADLRRYSVQRFGSSPAAHSIAVQGNTATTGFSTLEPLQVTKATSAFATLGAGGPGRASDNRQPQDPLSGSRGSIQWHGGASSSGYVTPGRGTPAMTRQPTPVHAFAPAGIEGRPLGVSASLTPMTMTPQPSSVLLPAGHHAPPAPVVISPRGYAGAATQLGVVTHPVVQAGGAVRSGATLQRRRDSMSGCPDAAVCTLGHNVTDIPYYAAVSRPSSAGSRVGASRPVSLGRCTPSIRCASQARGASPTRSLSPPPPLIASVLVGSVCGSSGGSVGVPAVEQRCPTAMVRAATPPRGTVIGALSPLRIRPFACPQTQPPMPERQASSGSTSTPRRGRNSRTSISPGRQPQHPATLNGVKVDSCGAAVGAVAPSAAAPNSANCAAASVGHELAPLRKRAAQLSPQDVSPTSGPAWQPAPEPRPASGSAAMPAGEATIFGRSDSATADSRYTWPATASSCVAWPPTAESTMSCNVAATPQLGADSRDPPAVPASAGNEAELVDLAWCPPVPYQQQQQQRRQPQQQLPSQQRQRQRQQATRACSLLQLGEQQQPEDEDMDSGSGPQVDRSHWRSDPLCAAPAMSEELLDAAPARLDASDANGHCGDERVAAFAAAAVPAEATAVVAAEARADANQVRRGADLVVESPAKAPADGGPSVVHLDDVEAPTKGIDYQEAAMEQGFVRSLREVFNGCAPVGRDGVNGGRRVDPAELVAACRLRLRASGAPPRATTDNSWDVVELALEQLESGGCRDVSWTEFWGSVCALRASPTASPTGAATVAGASMATSASPTGGSIASAAGSAGVPRPVWVLGAWNEQQAARHRSVRAWVVARALACHNAAHHEQIQVREGAQLRAVAREVDTDILAVVAGHSDPSDGGELGGPAGLDLETKLELSAASRLPLVRPYCEQLLQDALGDLACRVGGEGVLRVKDPKQAEDAVRAYTGQLGEALLSRLGASGGSLMVAAMSGSEAPTKRAAPRRN